MVLNGTYNYNVLVLRYHSSNYVDAMGDLKPLAHKISHSTVVLTLRLLTLCAPATSCIVYGVYGAYNRLGLAYQFSTFICWRQCVGCVSFLINATANPIAGRRNLTHGLQCSSAGP